MEALATPAAYTAALSTVVLGMNVEQWGILGIAVGIAMTFVTYFTNIYLKRRGN